MHKPQYTSCIYIGGLPILPPLMTAEIRQEMQKYKQLAAGIEQKISQRKDSFTQSEAIDSTSDPVTSVIPIVSDSQQFFPPENNEVDHPKDSPKTDIDNQSINENDKSLNRSVRRNSYTLETPSPQLMALLRSNQIEDVSISQNSNSESFTEVSKLSNSAKKQRTSSGQCYNANYDVSCPNHKPPESSTGALSTASDNETISSDIESIVTLDESAKRVVDSRSQISCNSESIPNQLVHDQLSPCLDDESSLDVSKIKDLKLSSRERSLRNTPKSRPFIKAKKKDINMELRKAFLRKTGVSREGTSLSLPTSLRSSPEPKTWFCSTENISSSPSRIPLSTKIPQRYHKLSERSQCSFKNTTIRNHLNEAKKVSRIKHERLFSSLIEDKMNISDDSKSILNQSKLPVYMPLRRSSLGFVPFKPDIPPKKNKPSSLCRRPHLNSKKSDLQLNINERENLPNFETDHHSDTSSFGSSICTKEIVMDENKNMQYELPNLNESFKKSLHVSEEDVPLSPINSNIVNCTTNGRNINKSQSRTSLQNVKNLQETCNESIYLHLSPPCSHSDVESLIDESPVIKSSPFQANSSPGRNSNIAQVLDRTPPTNFADLTNNNRKSASGGSRESNRSRKQLDFNPKNAKTLSTNNSLNNSFCDTISLSGSEFNDASVSSFRDRESSILSDAEVSDKTLSILLQELQTKHQQQMELLKQKQIEEQNLLEQKQKKITETILLNLSNGLSSSSTSPKSAKSEKSAKIPPSYDEIPVNRGITPLPSSDSASMTFFSSTPGFKQTSNSGLAITRYSLPPNMSKMVPNKIWFMNNVPATKFYPKKSYNELEIKAATIIQAGIRGYFVRRLMKTERVQLLIEMIQKSIKCALEIQQEPSPTLADYEFHARLIQQVTKACYEIHEIFIIYPQTEKFAIIAADRLKKFQKLNNSTPTVKPLSAATRRSLQRKFSQSSNDSFAQVPKKPYRSRSHTFTSSSYHEDLPKKKRYVRSATSFNLKKSQRSTHDTRVTNEMKRRVPWR
nr:PREDICTED: rho GTPase-activating protein gacG [Bemisia tabaci]